MTTTPKNSECGIYVNKSIVNVNGINKLFETSGIKLKFVLENINDKPELQTTKTVVSSPYDWSR